MTVVVVSDQCADAPVAMGHYAPLALGHVVGKDELDEQMVPRFINKYIINYIDIYRKKM
tara:strand:- start:59 stop:235 length:177 start_codon:yes stop_codon:yes gene_type:complete